MPIKFPKGFARRKSSGPALDEVENPPESSFKVFERPDGVGKSFDGPTAFRRTTDIRPLSSPGRNNGEGLFPDSRNLQVNNNRASGGTNHSASTGNFDSSSSARFSSSSTLPSSTDVSLLNDHPTSQHKGVPPHHSIPPSPYSLSTGRAFSFGNSKALKAAPSQPPPPVPTHTGSRAYNQPQRDRAMTTSTAGTAMPPKLLDNDLKIGGNDMDDFGNMFAGYGHPRATPAEAGVPRQTESPEPIRMPAAARIDSPPVRERTNLPPINTDRSRPIEPSPYSWGRDSHHSGDGLMDGRSPVQDAWGAKPPRLSTYSKDSREDLRTSVVQRSSAYNRGRDSASPTEEGRRLMSNSPVLNGPSKLNVTSATPRKHNDKDTSYAPRNEIRSVSLFDKAMDDDEDDFSNEWQQQSFDTAARTVHANSPEVANDAEFDENLAAHAALASQYEEAPPSPPRHTVINHNKVMTPAEFEKYRKQKEDDSRRWSNYSPSEPSEDEADTYDDEDETERNKQMAKQRQKQEAHLTVYRQQMMKVTGENTKLPNPGSTASMSTPNLPGRLSAVNLGQEKLNNKSGEEEPEDDEDVPLGILAAHGFPNKNRPPMRLTQTSSNPNLRASMMQQGIYPQAPGSFSGESGVQASRGNLPAFARQLPQDPYYGAGLVNQTNRESLAMGGGASVHGGPPTGLPPGGLIGVIAGEERARALRRASPNAQVSSFDQGNLLGNMGMRQSQMMPGGMPGMMGGMPPMTPGDQAQIQMSQQMTQMMQMQMQWMQQMMQMQGMSPQMPGGLTPDQAPLQTQNFLAPPGQMQRPMSMGNPMAGRPQPGDRTMSMLDPASAAQWGQRPGSFLPSLRTGDMNMGYAPSIAPSERSNVGMAPRYRPVSTAVDLNQKNPSAGRSSTFTSGNNLQAWKPQEKTTVAATIRAVSPDKSANTSKAKPKKESTASDEDDDAAWAELKKKRDKKKGNWRTKKINNGLDELYAG